MNELCRDLVKPIVEGPEPGPEVEVIDLTVNDEHDDADNSGAGANVAPAVPVKTEAVEIQVKTEDVPLAPGTISVNLEATDQSINPSIPSIPNSFCSDIAPKVEEHSQPGPSCLPPQPWEYVIVARDEEHAPIEELLNCLAIEELQSLVKSLKVKRTLRKVSRLQQWNGPPWSLIVA